MRRSITTALVVAGLSLAIPGGTALAAHPERSTALPVITVKMNGTKITVGGALQSGGVRVVSTVTGQVTDDLGAAEHWGRQVSTTVRFAGAVRTAASLGATVALDLGPEVEAREEPHPRQRVADVVGVALVEVRLRDAALDLLRQGAAQDGDEVHVPAAVHRAV